MGETSIEWAEHTWNPIRGCSRISPGCSRCYAERMAARDLPGHRSPSTGQPFAVVTSSGPHWAGGVELIPHMLEIPLRRRKPTTYFVNSMSDLFHESLPDSAIDQIFAVMALCPQHRFICLTKRAKRMRAWASRMFVSGDVQIEANLLRDVYHLEFAPQRLARAGKLNLLSISPEEQLDMSDVDVWPLPNVILGVSVEDQQRADERIPELLMTPAACRMLSVEPMLEPVKLELEGIGFVVVGGESGPGARPCNVKWIRSIVQQCRDAGVSCFVKQLGSNPVKAAEIYGTVPMRLKDRKGGDPTEWPPDLRVREFPRILGGAP